MVLCTDFCHVLNQDLTSCRTAASRALQLLHAIQRLQSSSEQGTLLFSAQKIRILQPSDQKYFCLTVVHDLQEGKELQAKAKAEAAVRIDAIKAQLARQLADRAQQEQQERQEEMEYAQLEQVRSDVSTLVCCSFTADCSYDLATAIFLKIPAAWANAPYCTHAGQPCRAQEGTNGTSGSGCCWIRTRRS
jgi:hypothetical protein